MAAQTHIFIPSCGRLPSGVRGVPWAARGRGGPAASGFLFLLGAVLHANPQKAGLGRVCVCVRSSSSVARWWASAAPLCCGPARGRGGAGRGGAGRGGRCSATTTTAAAAAAAGDDTHKGGDDDFLPFFPSFVRSSRRDCCAGRVCVLCCRSRPLLAGGAGPVRLVLRCVHRTKCVGTLASDVAKKMATYRQTTTAATQFLSEPRSKWSVAVETAALSADRREYTLESKSRFP